MWSSERFLCLYRALWGRFLNCISPFMLMSFSATWQSGWPSARAHAHTRARAYFPLMWMVLRIKQQEINILWNIWPSPSHRVNSCEHINQIKLIFFFSPSHLGENNDNQRGLRWWYSGWGSSRQCGGRGLDPWSGKIPHAWEQLSPRGTTAEASSCTYWARVPRARAPQRERQPQWDASVRRKEQPPLAAARESLRCNEDPAQPKINKQYLTKQNKPKNQTASLKKVTIVECPLPSPERTLLWNKRIRPRSGGTYCFDRTLSACRSLLSSFHRPLSSPAPFLPPSPSITQSRGSSVSAWCGSSTGRSVLTLLHVPLKPFPESPLKLLCFGMEMENWH